jgi:hypothetical protein
LASSPIAFTYGLHAFRAAPDRSWACVALALTTPELIAWCFSLLLNPPFAVLVAVVSALVFALRGTLEDFLG